MANLLDQASIVLTPTAYDNGKVLCAKPSEPPYGDFDFSRNSAATRVNAQGLVENVQILSSNLVQNGDFSEEGVQEISNGSFSQEGVEEITNGDFENGSTGWTLNGWTISNGKANCNGITANLIQYNVGSANKTFKLVFTISNYISGKVIPSFVGLSNESLEYNANGTYTTYISSLTDLRFVFYGNLFNGSIDNVSVREVGQDWTLGTGWSIGEDKAIFNGAAYKAARTNAGLITGKTYKVTFDLDITSGDVVVQLGGATNTFNTSTTHTFYDTATANGAYSSFVSLYSEQTSNFSITNISVKEVGQNWIVGSDWSIAENKAVSSGSGNNLQQTINILSNKTYKLTFDVISTSGTLAFDLGGATAKTLTDSGSKEYYFQSVNTNNLRFYGGNYYGDITNISVIEITDDTNLPRINYEGFSYQDAFGSEKIVNGDFSNGSANWQTEGFSSIIVGDFKGKTDVAKININNASTGSRIRQPFNYVSGKTYKVDIEVYVESGNFRSDCSDSFVSGDFVSTSTLGSWQTLTANITAISTGSNYIWLRSISGVSEFYVSNVSVKEYLGQEVVPDSGCGSWLWEPQSTNLITYSEDFSNAYWIKSGASVVSGFSSPDGSLNASLLKGDGLGSFPRIQTTVSGSGQISFSVFVKKELSDNVTIYISGTGIGGGAEASSVYKYTFSTDSFLITSGGTVNSSVSTSFGNDWVRLTLNYTTTTITGVRIYPKYASTSTDGVYIYGAQLEEQSYATSYIPTEGATVTRNQDVCTNGGSLASINSTEGTLYFEGSVLANDGTNKVITLSKSSDWSNRTFLRYDATANSITYRYLVNGSIKANLTHALSDATTINKIAIKWELNNFKLYVNGLNVGQDLSGSVMAANSLDTLNFNDGLSTLPFFGKTKAVAVWKEALSDQELADLTYPTPTDPTFSLNFDTIATDFTFARGSEATYVDAQGLIKSTNEIGEELITNGDFSTDGIPSTTSWSLGWYSQTSNVLISGGKLTLTNSASQSTALAYATDGVSSLNVVTVNKTYKLQYRVIENNGVTGFKYYSGGGSFIVAPTDLGVTHTIYIKNTANQIFLFQNATTNSSISIDNVSIKEYITATNTPRLDYSTGAEAFLLEPQSTNLVLTSDSGDFKIPTPPLTNTLAPDGTNNAVIPNPTSNANRYEYYLAGGTYSSGQKVTYSWYRKRISTPANDTFVGDLQIQALVNLTIFESTTQIQSNINGYDRFQVVVQVTDGSLSSTFRAYFGTVIGVGNSSVAYWGHQFEVGGYATSYIPTAGTTVTRNQETCINATPEINSEEGVLYAEISALADNGTFRSIALSDGTINNRIIIFYSDVLSELRAIIAYNGIFQTIINTNINVTDTNKIALKYRLNDVALWINGVEISVGNSATMPLGLNRLSFDRGDGANNFFGNTKDLQYYPKALSDAELIKLTT